MYYCTSFIELNYILKIGKVLKKYFGCASSKKMIFPFATFRGWQFKNTN